VQYLDSTIRLQKHGRKPPKHEQLIKGKVTLVNSYMECDRPLVEEALREHVAENE
jgi:hypothetical protein